MTLKHHTPHLVQLRLQGAGQRAIVHRAPYGRVAYAAAVFNDGFDDFTKSQHADNLAVRYHHQ